MSINLMLRYQGGGVFQTATTFDEHLANEKCPAGRAMFHEVREIRSVKQHRWFFKMIRTAFQNVPEARDWEFPSEGYLRDWALVRVGWAEHIEFDVEATAALSAINRLTAMIRRLIGREDKHVFVAQTPKGIRVSWPRSIAFAECQQRDMNIVTDLVLALLEHELGIPKGLLEPQIPDRHKREEAAT